MILKRLSLVLALVVLVGLVLPCFAETVIYEYDALYRVTKATYSDGTVIEYTYDAAGNRQSVIKIPSANAPSVSLSANPTAIVTGASATLTWNSNNVDSCVIDHGVGTVNTSGSKSVSPTTTTTYTITAMGGAGTATATATVTVTSPPTVTISANPASIACGASSTLAWTSSNATSCTINQGIGAVTPPENGSITVSPTQTTTYTITATGAGGTATSSVTVTVAPPPVPTVIISANPASIVSGQSSTLTWSSYNATSCSIDPRIGNVPVAGSIAVTPAATTPYTITATGAGGTATSSVTVTVAPPPPPTATISANPASIDYGSSSTLTWRSTNAASCSIDPDVGSVTPPEGGSISVSPKTTTTYTITATGLDGSTATARTTITVSPPPPQTTILRPDAAGDETNISSQQPSSGSHYDKVAEETPDEDSTYVDEAGASVLYHSDLYTLEHPSTAGTINWIKPWMRIGNTAGSIGGYAKTAIKTGGTVYEGPPIQAPGSWTNYGTQYTTNPKTGVAWTWADINSLQAGVSLRGGGAWLSGWGYRKSITLSRPSGAVTAYQMKLLVGQSAGVSGAAVDCGGHGKTDFSDLRFTAADGTTLLPYWIESIAGSTPNQLATIWIKFDSIGTTATTFYMYYGNAGASAASSGANTFIFFDDASANGKSHYTLRNLFNANLNATLSYINSTDGYRLALTAADEVMAEINTLAAGPAYRLRSRTKISAVTNGQMGLCARYSTAGVYYGRSIHVSSWPIAAISLTSEPTPPNTTGSGSDAVLYANLAAINTWYRQEFTAYGNTLYYWHELENKSVTWTDGSWTTGTWGIFGAYNSGTYIYFKDVTVGQYISPEPAWGSWGDEEAGGLDADCTQVYVEVNYTPSP